MFLIEIIQEAVAGAAAFSFFLAQEGKRKYNTMRKMWVKIRIKEIDTYESVRQKFFETFRL